MMMQKLLLTLQGKDVHIVIINIDIFLSGTFDFDLDEFDIISEHAKNFISALLQQRQGQRMTASQVSKQLDSFKQPV